MSQDEHDDLAEEDAVTYLDPTRNGRVQRRAYLITYSQVDPEKCRSRERFVEIVLTAINARRAMNNNVKEYACCKEDHIENGYHFHMCINLNRPMRWRNIKTNIEQTHNIVVNFSAQGMGYAWAARYVFKSDRHAIRSDGHRAYEPINMDIVVPIADQQPAQIIPPDETQTTQDIPESQPQSVQDEPPRKRKSQVGIRSKSVPVQPSIARLFSSFS